MVRVLLLIFLFHVSSTFAPAQARVFRMVYSKGTLTGVSKQDAEAAISVFGSRIVESDTSEVTLKTTICTRDELRKKIASADFDLSAMSTLDYLEFMEYRHLIPKQTAEQGGSHLTYIKLLVQTGSGIKDLADLNGRKILLESNAALDVYRLWLDKLLAEAGLPESSSFFSEILTPPNASKAVLPVFFGQADACLVSEYGYNLMKELNPQLGKRLTVLESSEGFLGNVICYREGLDKDLVERAEHVLKNLAATADGQQIMVLFKIEKVIPFQESMLESVIRLKNYFSENTRQLQ